MTFRFGGGGLWRIAYASLRLISERLPNVHAVEDMLHEVRDEVLHKKVGFLRALGRTPELEERGRGGEGFRLGVALVNLDAHDAPQLAAAKTNARGALNVTGYMRKPADRGHVPPDVVQLFDDVQRYFGCQIQMRLKIRSRSMVRRFSAALGP